MQFAAQNLSMSTNLNNDNLANQVGQLRSEIQQLQDQLTRAQETQAPPAQPTPPAPPPTPVVLIFNNGQRVETRGYTIAGRSLRFLSPMGYEKVDISILNIEETQSENHKR